VAFRDIAKKKLAIHKVFLLSFFLSHKKPHPFQVLRSFEVKIILTHKSQTPECHNIPGFYAVNAKLCRSKPILPYDGLPFWDCCLLHRDQ
jgi:hypothetical protein